MSVAAIGCVTLDRCMAEALAGKRTSLARREALRCVGPRFQRELHEQTAIAWQLATTEDLRYEGAEVVGVAAPPRLLRAYFDALSRVAMRDPGVMRQLIMVAQFLAPAATLFSPSIVCKGLVQMVRAAWNALASRARGTHAALASAAGKARLSGEDKSGAGGAAPVK